MTEVTHQDRTRAPLAKVVFLTGKGGVGKTTLAVGYALAEAREGRSVALLEFGDGESAGRILNDVPDTLDHIIIEPEEAMLRAAAPVFGSRLLTKLVFGNFAMKRFFHAAPAMRELAMLEVVRQCSEERPGQQIIVDLPATGHGLAWLRVPKQITQLSSRGAFHDLAEKLSRELIAPKGCSVVVVTLPEPMVLSETIELCEALETDIGLETARLIVNRIPVALPKQAAEDAAGLIEHDDAPFAAAAAALNDVVLTRSRSRRAALVAMHDALKRTGIIPTMLPEAPGDPDINDVAEWLQRGGAL